MFFLEFLGGRQQHLTFTDVICARRRKAGIKKTTRDLKFLLWR